MPSFSALATLTGVVILTSPFGGAQEPPAINPFGPRPQTRDDAVPGYVELSDGSIHTGKLYLTRDTRLKIFDTTLGRQREIPLRVVQAVKCTVEKEWLEKVWRFREMANDEKVYTGQTYPARIYEHTIVLKDGRRITGPLSGIIYVDEYEGQGTRKFLFHKRQKGPVGSDLKSLVYVCNVALGEQAMREGQQKRAQAKQANDE
jgi:hypothetical protein